MGLSTSGLGAIDVENIVSQLMSIEQQPLTALARKESSYQAKLSAVASLKSALSTFQGVVKSLSDIGKFQGTKATSADTAIATVTGSAGATAGSYSLEVTKLAQAQKLVSGGQAATNTAIGTGTLTFDFGTIDASSGSFDAATGKYTGATFTSNGAGAKTITIDSSNNTLSGIRDAINSANIGVSAAIVNDGGTTPYRLVLTELSSGKTNSMKISVTGDPALAGLLAHDPARSPAQQALAETAAAQNAEFKLDGIAISKTTNSVSDVIDGVSLNLVKTNEGSPIKISVARDTSGITSAINQFVSAYNQINQTLNNLTSYNATTRQAGPLNGDATARGIQTQIRGILSAPIEGGGIYTVLSQIGVTLQKDGTLAVDNTKLQKAIDEKATDIAGLFAAAGKASDSLVHYSAATSKTTPGTYEVNISQVATQGKTTGSASAALTIDASNDTLDVKLDGLTATIKLGQGTYASADALALEIQSKINGVTAFSSEGSSVSVTQTAGKITLVSARYGSASHISITGGNGMAALLGAAPVSTDGLNVAGTLNGVPATGAGQYLTGADGSAAEGLKLLIDGGSAGDRGTVVFSKGYAYQFDKLVASVLSSTGAVTAKTDGLNATLKNLSQQKQRLADRLDDIEARYRKQYAALDAALTKMTQTSNYLSQQLAALSATTEQ